MAMNSAPSSRYRTAREPITPISDSALEIGCVCTTTLTAQTTAIAAKARNKMTSMAFQENKATINAVASRFSTAAGNKNFQAKPINWSYRKRGSVPRIQMKTNNRNPVLARNQNNGIRTDTAAGTSSNAASPKKIT